MAFKILNYRFTADGGQFRREARSMDTAVSKIGAQISGLAGGFSMATGAAAGLLAMVDQIQKSGREFDRTVIGTTIASELLGGRPEALAVEAVGTIAGVGSEQYFDAAEAVRDALTNKTGEAGQSARDAAEAIGLDRDAFLDEDLTNFERSNMLLDALLAVEGTNADRLQAASELGSGDLRDFVSLAGLVRQTPELHPRVQADQIRAEGLYLSDDTAAESTSRELEKRRDAALGREILAERDWWDPDRIRHMLPLIGGERLERRVAQEERMLVEHGKSTRPPPVVIEVQDSTGSGVRISQRVSDVQSDGGVVTTNTERPPSR